jgi:hypothetical protein
MTASVATGDEDPTHMGWNGSYAPDSTTHDAMSSTSRDTLTDGHGLHERGWTVLGTLCQSPSSLVMHFAKKSHEELR